jgi:hypothetical protein
MKTRNLILAGLMFAVFLFANVALGEEYYLVKSRSGIFQIVDHQPKGGATIVKGPFKSKQEADQALAELKKQ